MQWDIYSDFIVDDSFCTNFMFSSENIKYIYFNFFKKKEEEVENKAM